MRERRSLPPHEDELSLALLRSADHDEPSSAAYAKAATALGVGAAVGIGASLPVPAALASAGLSASAAARWSGSLLVKVAVVGVSGVLLVAGSLSLLYRQGRAAGTVSARGVASASLLAANNAAPASPRAVFPSTGAVALAAPTTEPAPAAPGSAAPAQPASVARGAVAPGSVAPNGGAASPTADVATSASSAVKSALVGAHPPSERARVSSLPEQVLSLDRARVALNSGDPSGALAEIAHYRSAWPRGVFLTEASVLEIEALAKRGEIVLAGMRAQAFVTAHPDSPQVERLRALIPSASR
jgi:hypothetical protein